MNAENPEKTASILIVEDARSDRARFRLLVEKQQRDDDFEFAWRWQREGRCTVREWFSAVTSVAGESAVAQGSFHDFLEGLTTESQDSLKTRLLSYRLILLDLAWSGRGEQVMQSRQYLNEEEGQRIADETRANGEGGVDASGLLDVEGIALLEWLARRLESKPVPTSIWVTSSYVAETALGLRAFLRHRYGPTLGIEIRHKWIDEDAISMRLGGGRLPRG